MRVKICGMKNDKDLSIAIDSGADALGFLVGQKHFSNDFISEELAKELIKKIPPYIQPVLVTHLSDSSDIWRIAKYIRTFTIQLHSDISQKEIQILRGLQYTDKEKHDPYIRMKLIKSLHANMHSLSELYEQIRSLENDVDAFIVDTFDLQNDKAGGTGKTHDWSISRKLVENSKCPIILSGGLNPENVAEAIKIVKPFGIDANSQLKRNDGYKDKQKVLHFVYNAKNEFFRQKIKL